ncbi:MAG: hypothetical protein HC853_00730 [Anaerolineae bacterium]|nr:hypothetical protein [Anaerolineae bacterium]
MNALLRCHVPARSFSFLALSLAQTWEQLSTFYVDLDAQSDAVRAVQMLDANQMTHRMRHWAQAGRIGHAFAQRYPQVWSASHSLTQIERRMRRS